MWREAVARDLTEAGMEVAAIVAFLSGMSLARALTRGKR